MLLFNRPKDKRPTSHGLDENIKALICAETLFLASQDALEVVLVSESVIQSVSKL